MCRDSSRRPVRRLLQEPREDIRISWARVLARKGMRNGWVLTIFWKAESTGFLDSLDERCQRERSLDVCLGSERLEG